jgi:hypothetical protein
MVLEGNRDYGMNYYLLMKQLLLQQCKWYVSICFTLYVLANFKHFVHP